jgi:hypothetical protein
VLWMPRWEHRSGEENEAPAYPAGALARRPSHRGLKLAAISVGKVATPFERYRSILVRQSVPWERGGPKVRW